MTPDALSLSRSELPEEIERAIDAFEATTFNAGNWGLSLTDQRIAARSALTAAILSRLGEAEFLAESWKATAEAEAEIGNERRDEAVAALARVERLEKALEPFAAYADHMPGQDFGEGEIGGYYHEGFRRSIRTVDLKAAHSALTEAGRLAIKDA